MENTTV